MTEKMMSILQKFLTAIRILIGWHFLYEGLTKLFSPNWSSASYLMESHWLLSGFFHWIAEHPAILKVVDLLNIWGLILIGLGLFLGILTRIAGGAGVLLLLLYYIANPPFVGFVSEVTGEGHYLIVNKNLIEMIVLFIFVFLPKHFHFSFDRIIYRFTKKEKTRQQEYDKTRRELLKDLVSLPLLGGFIGATIIKRQSESFEERHLVSQPSRTDAVSGASPKGVLFASIDDLKAKVPCGKIGDLEISRIICGGNLISGYAHARDLIYASSLIQSYFTDERVMETLRLCEACGINTAIIRVDNNTLNVIRKYRKRGGKIQWIAQAKITEKDLASDIDAAVDNGALGVYVHGGICDNMVEKGRIDLLGNALEHIKKHKVIAGIAAHALVVPIACEKAGLDPDFYLKTLNSGNYWTAGPRLPKPGNWVPKPHQIVEPEYIKGTHDNIWSITPQQTIEFMKDVKKPWIAYKVLGAGAIHPKEGFQYAFENGADFLCVGMFDFQIVEDANICSDILSSLKERSRPWMV